MKSSARSATSALVTMDGISSTRRITGTGLKKCSPTTCSGRPLATASFMIGIDDVFDARIASSSMTILPRLRNTSSFSSSNSPHRLDHELAVGELADVGDEADVPERGHGGVVVELPGTHGLLQ